ncbi:Predicted oxidoreductase [Leifsonia sp. 98AMF]|jgi:aryl-alcohol dehydrogenase-like predicted oxidoreductase|uniref:aldo/keto reductase n=1 Tax=unclassified Leifsonia TaxID=2663824 RepID=UPI00087C51A9|nr:MULTISPECIES: aldo/keto reductase [unclassified Leifsonia]SDH06600.1 Predicted oxidoreductase [Leifsonia sp. 197AMF]SDJ33696.1 Predicted oxidoreductase [Leifsonia sp. 466MF]SDK46230.1 Predicted oxidoreductase [Leifsonia sp. 157MF]SDN54573.1 Predicted oxidoreductase [Leifsonia sp. 509MF]SEN55365.1 Predicted oxidoreductase [Leifsonia sp. 467MF]
MTAPRRTIGSSDLEVFPLSLGGNVFGWTADRETSFDVLDGYTAAGGNFVDTADGYSAWVPGNTGGDSERILGEWFEARGNRDQVVLATKVSQHPDFKGLAADNIRRAADASLERLKSDYIDLYYAHFDDETVPLEETVAALSGLVDAGKVRYIGISNYSPERIEEWFRITEREGLHRAVALQPHYNLVERGYETTYRPIAEREGLGVMPYFALAAGFLTGKYRDGVTVDSARAGGAAKYLDDTGRAVLSALDEVAAAHGASVASVALAWLAAQPTITAPIASARTTEQLPDLLASVELELTGDELEALAGASEAAKAA